MSALRDVQISVVVGSGLRRVAGGKVDGAAARTGDSHRRLLRLGTLALRSCTGAGEGGTGLESYV